MPKKVCILGAGLCGISIAWQQEKLGRKVHLIDASKQIGGVLQSVKDGGYLMDYGANTFNIRLQETYNLLEEMGVLEHAIDANPQANKRFIIRDGDLVELPHNFLSFLFGSFLSPLGKLRLLLEPFIAKGNLDGNESVAEFITRRLGREVLEYCVNPFIGGIYASKPENLSLAHAFPTLFEMEKNKRSIFLGSMNLRKNANRISKSRLISFPNGMAELIHLISSKISGEVTVEQKVTAIHKLDDGWKIISQSKDRSKVEGIYDEVICTLPAHCLLEIDWLGIGCRENLKVLASALNYPINLVYLGYDEAQVKTPLDGFGFLAPEKENLNILGSLFSSTLFPGRAPPGKILLTTFIGGERKPELTELDDFQTFNLAIEDLSKLLRITGSPEFKSIKRWKQGIPLPDLKMGERKKAARAIERNNRGLSFSGSHLTGVSLPNCLQGNYSNF